MTVQDLFYAYGAFYIVNSIYHIIKSKIKKEDAFDFTEIDPKDRSPEEILETAKSVVKKKVKPLGLTIVILDIIWNAIGIFATEFWLLFLLIFITHVTMLITLVMTPKEKQSKVSDIFMIINILTAATILIRYFYPLLLEG